MKLLGNTAISVTIQSFPKIPTRHPGVGRDPWWKFLMAFIFQLKNLVVISTMGSVLQRNDGFVGKSEYYYP